MRENLANFLADVALDPDRAALFAASPESQLQEVDLTRAERAAVLARDSRRIAAELGDSGFAIGEVSNTKKPSRKAPGKKKSPAKKKTPKRTPAKKAPRKGATRKSGGKKR